MTNFKDIWEEAKRDSDEIVEQITKSWMYLLKNGYGSCYKAKRMNGKWYVKKNK